MGNTNRQIYQHLYGDTPLTIDIANSLGMLPGEIAIKHGTDGSSEIYVLSQDGKSIDTFAPKTYVDQKIFYGTQIEYETAYNEGRIPIGAIVVIDDDNNDATSSVLGKGILGKMILG